MLLFGVAAAQQRMEMARCAARLCRTRDEPVLLCPACHPAHRPHSGGIHRNLPIAWSRPRHSCRMPRR